MFAQESVMEIQNDREAFQKFCEENFDFERHEQTYFEEQTQCYENDIGEDTESINMAWMAWQAAKAQAVPEGFVLMPKENISCYWQDNDEPENFCSNESDFDCLGDCIDLGEIMEINKFTQAHVNKEILFGTWFTEAIDPSEKANFFVGTHAECLEIVAKNKAMIEAQEPTND